MEMILINEIYGSKIIVRKDNIGEVYYSDLRKCRSVSFIKRNGFDVEISLEEFNRLSKILTGDQNE